MGDKHGTGKKGGGGRHMREGARHRAICIRVKGVMTGNEGRRNLLRFNVSNRGRECECFVPIRLTTEKKDDVVEVGRE